MKKQEKELRVDISKRLKQMRKALGMTQEQVAQRLEVVRTTYVRYESGYTIPGLLGWETIALKLGVSLDWLLTGRGEMFYQGPVVEEPSTALEPAREPDDFGPLGNDVREMVHQMIESPELRYQVMGLFYQFQMTQKALPEK